MVHSALMNHVFRSVEGIAEFQVIQKARDLLIANIVGNGRLSDGAKQLIREKICEHMGRVDIQINLVGKILPEKSGKFRYVISEISGSG